MWRKKERGVSGVAMRYGEKQDENAMLKKGINMWQSVDKRYGLVSVNS